MDDVHRWSKTAELTAKTLLAWLGVSTSKFHEWKRHYGTPHAHHAHMPRDGWLAPWEKQAILDFHERHPLDGYRRLAYMMLDEDVAAVSPSSVYRVLKAAGRLDRKWRKALKKGTGFTQPLGPHEHWHVDISYLNLGGTFYYLCSVLDGYSRYLVHHEIRQSMTEQDVETILQRALEKFPEATPRVISDNGPQFIARDFKEFIRILGMTHVRTSPYYPQSNGKLERWHGSLRQEHWRLQNAESLGDARRVVAEYVDDYNHRRLHSALGYITPADMLNGLADVIFADRDQKLAAARERRRATWRAAREVA